MVPGDEDFISHLVQIKPRFFGAQDPCYISIFWPENLHFALNHQLGKYTSSKKAP